MSLLEILFACALVGKMSVEKMVIKKVVTGKKSWLPFIGLSPGFLWELARDLILHALTFRATNDELPLAIYACVFMCIVFLKVVTLITGTNIITLKIQRMREIACAKCKFTFIEPKKVFWKSQLLCSSLKAELQLAFSTCVYYMVLRN